MRVGCRNAEKQAGPQMWGQGESGAQPWNKVTKKPVFEFKSPCGSAAIETVPPSKSLRILEGQRQHVYVEGLC